MTNVRLSMRFSNWDPLRLIPGHRMTATQRRDRENGYIRMNDAINLASSPPRVSVRPRESHLDAFPF